MVASGFLVLLPALVAAGVGKQIVMREWPEGGALLAILPACRARRRIKLQTRGEGLQYFGAG
jgi:hypothetical protein